MNSLKKRKNVYFSIIYLLFLLLSYYVNINSNSTIIEKLSESLFWLSAPILFFSLINLFFREETFISWSKFTIYYFIISVILVLISPNSTHGMDIYPATKENVTIVLSVMYSVFSLVLIAYKSFKKTN